MWPKKALKVLCIQKQAQIYEGQPSALLEGPADVLATIATAANVLPSTMPTTKIQTFSTKPSICTLIRPNLPSVEDLKSQLEA